MAFEFTFTKKQEFLRETIRGLTKHVIRPQSLAWDKAHGIPEEFLRTMATLNTSMTSSAKKDDSEKAEKVEPTGNFGMKNLDTLLVTEELAWGDAALPLCMPGPGLGGPPVRGTGTPEQKKRYMGIFEDMSETLKWGAYALTEPGAGSDVAGIRTSCRKEGNEWVLNGRKCYITNGARASWNVVFATIDPSLGRAGHRAFVVEKGTKGFSVGRIEEKMGLRASETAELVLEDCRVSDECLLGGEDSYLSLIHISEPTRPY